MSNVHKWEPCRWATMDSGREIVIAWTCQKCGLRKRRGVMNRVRYWMGAKDMGQRAGDCEAAR
jgi:hypothetical protein